MTEEDIKTQEELQAELQKEIDAAKASIQKDAVDKAAISSYKQGQEDAAQAQKMKEMEAQLAEANRKIEEEQAKAQQAMKDIDAKYSAKFDEILAKSKQVVSNHDPFKSGGEATIESLSDEQVDDIEAASREEFFEYFKTQR